MIIFNQCNLSNLLIQYLFFHIYFLKSNSLFFIFRLIFIEYTENVLKNTKFNCLKNGFCFLYSYHFFRKLATNVISNYITTMHGDYILARLMSIQACRHCPSHTYTKSTHKCNDIIQNKINCGTVRYKKHHYFIQTATQNVPTRVLFVSPAKNKTLLKNNLR